MLENKYINASERFVEECKNGANCNRIGYIAVDSNTTYTEKNNLVNFTIEEGCYVDGNIIGSIYIKTLTGQLIGVDSTEKLIDNSILAGIGINYGSDDEETVLMGNYTVERPNTEKTAKESQITAYSYLHNKLNDKYVSGLDYENETITVLDLFRDVCNNLGLQTIMTSFLNSDIEIQNNPFTNGETNRIVLQSIAKVACSFVTVTEELSFVELSWLSESEEPDYIFELSDYSTLEGGEIKYGPINSIIIKNSQIDSENVQRQDDESIEENGEHQLVISEDYILYNSDLRNQAMDAIYNRLNGLKYVDAKITCYYGKPFLKIGAKIRIYTTETDYFDTYVLNHKFTYDGAFTSVIESPALTQQEIKIKQNVSLGEALRNTEIIVNKQAGEISSIVSKTAEIDVRENNNYQELIGKFDGFVTENDIVELENSVRTLQTDTYTKTEINTKLTDGSVTRVNTMSGTFDENGMHYEKTNAPTKSTINEKGLTVESTTGSGEELLFAGYDENSRSSIVRTANINVTNFLVIHNRSRIEKYENGTGVFML